VTVIDPALTAAERIDPFAVPAGASAPSRPRLLSYVGRWGRARRWLPSEAHRVLDVGCSFGYGTAAIAQGGPPGRVVVGVERDPAHLDRASRSYPWVRILDADAGALPVPDGCADAVILLDVIEHIAEPRRAFAEAHRVLAPGGAIIVTVPHAGLLGGLDALNLYARLRRMRPSLAPLEAATESDGGPHRHYRACELEAEMHHWFVVDRVARSGLGLQELVTLAMIVIRMVLHAPRVARVLMPVHFVLTGLDYAIPAGPLAYNLAVRGRVIPSQVQA
jgi:SAM-dependent methyltransferase